MPVVTDARDVGVGGRDVLSDVEERVLAALSRSPRGLFPVASVAAVGGVDEVDAAEALWRLELLGLVAAGVEVVATHPTRRDTVWRLGAIDAWNRVADDARAMTLPPRWPPPPADELPDRLRYLFWWGDPAAIELPRDAAFVAGHILRSHDIGAWGWALGALPVESLEQVSARDCTPAPLRAMIRNAVARRRGEPR